MKNTYEFKITHGCKIEDKQYEIVTDFVSFLVLRGYNFEVEREYTSSVVEKVNVTVEHCSFDEKNDTDDYYELVK